MIIGSRGSLLAIAQTKLIVNLLLSEDPSLKIETKIIKTKGDQILDRSISEIGDKGLFVKELEVALQNREIDIAVHSVKDLPAEIPDDLILAAFPKREDPSDLLVTAENLTIEALPKNAVIGTSALRRQSQLLHFRPDLQIKLLRGNVDTRLRKLDEGHYFGIILAKAGLNRLGISRGIVVAHSILLPSPGQGALALETRKDDPIVKILRKINDPATETCVRAERSFLLTMEGGCQVPLGALAALNNANLVLEGFFGTPDGRHAAREKGIGDPQSPEKLGEIVAKSLLRQAGSQKAVWNGIKL